MRILRSILGIMLWDKRSGDKKKISGEKRSKIDAEKGRKIGTILYNEWIMID